MQSIEYIDASNGHLSYEAKLLAAGAWNTDLLVLDNYSVNALAGNANNPDLQARIVEVKGEGRLQDQVVGWTRPFTERMLESIDIDAISDRKMQALLRDPTLLGRLVGGSTFIRAKADLAAKERLAIPDCIIPPNGPTVQIYSPEGITTTEEITRMAIDLGVEPVMTSANTSKEPESITMEAGLEFMRNTPEAHAPPKFGLFFNDENSRPFKPGGSYPIIFAEADRFVGVRLGCFGPDILEAQLDGFRFDIADNASQPKYADRVLHLSDFSADVRSLRGPELTEAMYTVLGWKVTASAA